MLFAALPEANHKLVSLRPIMEADLPVWYAYLSTPAVFEHTSWNLSSSSELSPYVWAPEAATESSLLRLAIALRSTGELIGTAGFHTVSPQNRSAELAFDLSPSVWGQGIATYVCQLLVAWAHASVGLLRVQATVLESNARSAAVLERSGFLREGLLRSYRLVRGSPGDFFMYSHVQPLHTVS
jgi:ribosomal-protein-alanine N-acetyltransferase